MGERVEGRTAVGPLEFHRQGAKITKLHSLLGVLVVQHTPYAK
jgi:hypothetical protein